jgi:hypothetical protein
MTLCMWIKSHIKADKASYSKRRQKETYQWQTQTQYCWQYYIYGSKSWSAQIATKTARYKVTPKLYASSSANSPGTHRDKPQEALFDSNSFLIQVDSGASCSISNCKAHFETLEPIDPKGSHKISGPTGEESPIKAKGTLKWKIEDDDDGAVHMIRLKDSLYVPATLESIHKRPLSAMKWDMASIVLQQDCHVLGPMLI